MLLFDNFECILRESSYESIKVGCRIRVNNLQECGCGKLSPILIRGVLQQTLYLLAALPLPAPHILPLIFLNNAFKCRDCALSFQTNMCLFEWYNLLLKHLIKWFRDWHIYMKISIDIVALCDVCIHKGVAYVSPSICA